MRADGAIATALATLATAAVILLRSTYMMHLSELLPHMFQRRLHMAHDLLPQADPVVVECDNLAGLVYIHAILSVIVPQQLVIRQIHHTGCSILRGPLLHPLLIFTLL